MLADIIGACNDIDMSDFGIDCWTNMALFGLLQHDWIMNVEQSKRLHLL